MPTVSPEVGILWRVLVTVRAMGSEDAMQTAPSVLAIRHRFYMGTVDARGGAAEVVEVEASWYRANHQFVRDAMG